MSLFLEVKISDGLGNQLFQYATARSLCIKNKIPYLLLNTESFKNNNLGRQFGLNNFPVAGRIIQNDFIKKLLRKNTKYNRIISICPFYKSISEKGLKLQQLSEKTGLLTSLQGYWQSEYYFKDIRAILLEELVPLNLPSFPDWINNKNTVAVHVRRTDYLSENTHGALNEKYYKNAMHFIQDKVSNPLFIFFSDDIIWCKENFTNSNIFFCEDEVWNKDYLQLFLMSKCAHQIIANSSFSWWGAWLNDNPEKIVIRPAIPFSDNTLQYESYYPANWVAVAN